MAEKTVSVRLKLIHDSYMKAAREAGTATDNVAKADKWKQLGKQTAGLGDTLTRNVTLPIIGVGVAATKMSMDFDSVFVQMQSLAGATADEIDGMKDQVLDLAGETGKAPKELADALYFLRSSGLDASDAMDALEMSAKASATGMGSTVDIADAVSSAMNAYAKSGLSAAAATDVLVATAREGKAEPAELAKQMGRLLPLSSELGITFQDVGAALAALSLSGNDAAGASTLLSNIMSKLLKPSQQASEALAAVGISGDDIRKMIADGDLLSTLETLRASLGDAGFTKFLEDAQAVQGGLALTGENVEKNRKIFEELNDSVGATDEAFGKWAESMGAKNAKAWGQFQAAMIRLGDTLAPLATDIIGFASKVLEAFDKLPGPLKKIAAGLVIAAAAAGPLMSVGGRMISIWASMSKVIANVSDRIGNNFGSAMASAMNQGAGATDGMSRKMGGLQKAAGLAAGAAGVGAVLFAIHEIGEARKAAQIDKLVEDFLATGEAAEEMAAAADGSKFALGDLSKMFDQLLDTNLVAAERLLDELSAAGVEAKFIDAGREALERRSDATVQAAKDSETNTQAIEEATGAYDEEADAVTQAVEALQKYADTLKAQFDPLFGVMDAAKGVRDARLGVEEATVKLSEAEKEFGKDSAEAAAASRDLADAHDDAVVSALDLEVAQAGLAAAVEDGSVSVDEARTMLARWVEQGHITQAEADVTAAKFTVMTAGAENYTGGLRGIPGFVSTEIRTPNAVQAREGIEGVGRAANNLDGKVINIYVRTHEELLAGYGASPRSGGRSNARALGGPVRRNEGYLVGEDGVEWFEPEQNGRIISNHDLAGSGAGLAQQFMGQMTPQSAYGGGGNVTVIHQTISLKGAIISSSSDAERWVSNAFNRAASRNMVNVRGRLL